MLFLSEFWRFYKKVEKILKNVLTTMRKISIINLVGRTHGRLAQLGEHLPYKQGVIGSSPIATTIFYGLVVQLVRTLACHARGRRFEPVPGRHFFWLYSSVGRARD